jgi:hypothetical protein
MDTSHSIAAQIELKRAIAELEILMRKPEPSAEKLGKGKDILALASALELALFLELNPKV